MQDPITRAGVRVSRDAAATVRQHERAGVFPGSAPLDEPGSARGAGDVGHAARPGHFEKPAPEVRGPNASRPPVQGPCLASPMVARGT